MDYLGLMTGNYTGLNGLSKSNRKLLLPLAGSHQDIALTKPSLVRLSIQLTTVVPNIVQRILEPNLKSGRVVDFVLG